MCECKTRIDIQICTKDRWAELGMLLQSLRTQTHCCWDIQIVDGSQTPMMQSNFIPHMLNRLKLEGHDVKIARDALPGVCSVRNQCHRMGSNPLVLRIDDDSVVQPDFIEQLLKAMPNEEIGAVGCVVPTLQGPPTVRNSELFKDRKMSKITIDKDGTITEIGDDLWAEYTEPGIFEVDHVRSSFMMWRDDADKIIEKYGELYDTAYGLTGFREETDVSLKLKMMGKKLLVNTAAIAFHLRTPSGGVRAPDYAERCAMGDERLRRQVKKWAKENKLQLQNTSE